MKDINYVNNQINKMTKTNKDKVNLERKLFSKNLEHTIKKGNMTTILNISDAVQIACQLLYFFDYLEEKDLVSLVSPIINEDSFLKQMKSLTTTYVKTDGNRKKYTMDENILFEKSFIEGRIIYRLSSRAKKVILGSTRDGGFEISEIPGEYYVELNRLKVIKLTDMVINNVLEHLNKFWDIFGKENINLYKHNTFIKEVSFYEFLALSVDDREIHLENITEDLKKRKRLIKAKDNEKYKDLYLSCFKSLIKKEEFVSTNIKKDKFFELFKKNNPETTNRIRYMLLKDLIPLDEETDYKAILTTSLQGNSNTSIHNFYNCNHSTTRSNLLKSYELTYKNKGKIASRENSLLELEEKIALMNNINSFYNIVRTHIAYDKLRIDRNPDNVSEEEIKYINKLLLELDSQISNVKDKVDELKKTLIYSDSKMDENNPDKNSYITLEYMSRHNVYITNISVNRDNKLEVEVSSFIASKLTNTRNSLFRKKILGICNRLRQEFNDVVIRYNIYYSELNRYEPYEDRIEKILKKEKKLYQPDFINVELLCPYHTRLYDYVKDII